jgi:hypothetical protein
MSTRCALAGSSSRRSRRFALTTLAVALSTTGPATAAVSGSHARAVHTLVPAWRVVGNPAVSPGGVLCTQVRVAPDGVPHLAYQDFTAPAHQLGACRFVNGAWAPVTTANVGSTGDAWYNRLAFLDDGSLFVASRDYGLAGALGVRRCAYPGAPWVALGGAAASPGEAHYTDVAATRDGRILAAYQDRTTVPIDRTTVIEWNGSAWSTLTGIGLSGGYSAYQSLAVQRDGTILVAFTDGALAGRASVFAYVGSGSWQAIGPQGFTPDIPNNLVLRLGPDGTPFVAYYVWSTRIVVRRFDGNGWPTVGFSATGSDIPTVETEGWRQWLGFEIDSAGRPVVAYEAANLGRRAVVRRWEPALGAWLAIGDEGFTPGSADYLSLDLAPDDTPYVAFRDGTTGRASVMAWR